MKKNVFKKYLKRFIFIFVIIIPFILGIILSIFLSLEYQKAYIQYKKNQDTNMNRLRYYYRALNQTILPQVYVNKPTRVNVEEIESRDIGLMTNIYDIQKNLIGNLYKEKRVLVGLNDISDHFIKTLIFVEDRRFYEHSGIDYKGVLRALWDNILEMRFAQGGSTITQQLAKILFTNQEKSIQRKIYQILIAEDIEKNYDKNSILLMYLNYIYFGYNINGVEKASSFYFSKKAKDLNLMESIFLVSIIRNPSYYSPFKNKARSKKRHLHLIYSLFSQGFLKYEKKVLEKLFQAFWKKYKFDFNPYTGKKEKIKTSYIIEEVRRRLMSYLEERFEGNKKEKAKHFLYTQGLRIFTSIDRDMQLKAKDILQKHLDDYRDFLIKKRIIKNEERDKIQGALISMEPSTGYIKTMIGGYDFTVENQYNRAIQAKRQPGSIFKPIFYLGLLDDHLFSAYSLERDVYAPIVLDNGEIWEVKNYNKQYQNRPITLTKALKISSNQVAARLIRKVGLKKIKYILGKTLGIPFEVLEESYPDHQYSTVLGSVLMSPLEVAQVYSMMINNGIRVHPRFILDVYDFAGDLVNFKEIQVNEFLKEKVVSKEAAYIIFKMLREVLKPGGTAHRIAKQLEFSDFAAKTGTSQDSRDLWFVGLNKSLVTVIWIGHDDNLPLYGASGYFLAPLFRDYILALKDHVSFSSVSYDNSYHFHRARICKISGLIATKDCPEVDEEGLFIEFSKTEPSDYCQLNHNLSDELITKALDYYFDYGSFYIEEANEITKTTQQIELKEAEEPIFKPVEDEKEENLNQVTNNEQNILNE